jgi:subtilisin family serine protease
VFKIKASTRLDVNPRGLSLLGDTVDWIYFVVPTDLEATKLHQQLALYESGSGPPVVVDFFGKIDSIGPYGTEDRRGRTLPPPGFDDTKIVDVVLWASPDPATAAQRLDDVDRVLAAFNGQLLASDRRAATTMARVQVTSAGLEALLDLMVVEKVHSPVAPFLEPSDWLQADANALVAEAPLDVVVGVIDDGASAAHPLLAGLIVDQVSIPDGRSWAKPSTHGTMVAGLAAYGDFEVALRDGGRLPAPAHLAIARVLEPDPDRPDRTRFPSSEPDHVVLEQAIRHLAGLGVRIINLSITDPDAYSGPHVSLWTETVDRLTRELDLVIVVAAGNRALPVDGEIREGVHVHHSYPTYLHDDEARLAEPSVAANAITVGSLSRSAASAQPDGRTLIDDRAIAGEHEVSPFSRTGPGINGTYQAGAVKPEFVHYGGNAVWNGLNRIETKNVGAAIVSTAQSPSGRLFSVSSGTSFAAPRVARTAAAILTERPDASANLIRALLGISARTPGDTRQFPDEAQHLRAVGYGLPNEARATTSEQSRVVMLHEGTIATNTAVIHPIPIPEEFARGKADRTIRIAIAHDPPVRRQRREYTGAHLGLDLYRALSADDVEDIARKQIRGRVREKPRNRTLKTLAPGVQTCGASTLQVRTWDAPSANSFKIDDGDVYYLVVKHYVEAWATKLDEPYDEQAYALVVEIEDRERSTIDLYATLQAQIQHINALRIRLDA